MSTLRNFWIASVSGCIAAFASHCLFSNGRLGIDFDFFFFPFPDGIIAAISAGVGSIYTAAPLVDRNWSASVTSWKASSSAIYESAIDGR